MLSKLIEVQGPIGHHTLDLVHLKHEEGQNVEFKESLLTNKQLVRYFVAAANNFMYIQGDLGMVLWFGINDNAKIVGIKSFKNYQKSYQKWKDEIRHRVASVCQMATPQMSGVKVVFDRVGIQQLPVVRMIIPQSDVLHEYNGKIWVRKNESVVEYKQEISRKTLKQQVKDLELRYQELSIQTDIASRKLEIVQSIRLMQQIQDKLREERENKGWFD